MVVLCEQTHPESLMELTVHEALQKGIEYGDSESPAKTP